MHPQLRSSRLYIAQQRSAAQCGAVPCPSLCGAVSCGAVRSFEHTAVVVTRYDTGTRFMDVLCTRLLLSSVDCPLLVPMFPPPARKYNTCCRSERDINKHAAQRRAISSAQAPLGIIINSIFAPKNCGPLLPAPLYICFSYILLYASVAGGLSRPRSGVLCFL